MSGIIDVILISVLALQIFLGWRRGLTGVVLGFARIILSFLTALALGPAIGDTLGNGGFFARVLGYISEFAVTFVGATVLMYIFRQIKIPLISKIDKLLGILIGAVLGALTVSLVAVMLNSLLSAMTMISDNEVYIDVYNNSHVFKFINECNIFGFIKDVLM